MRNQFTQAKAEQVKKHVDKFVKADKCERPVIAQELKELVEDLLGVDMPVGFKDFDKDMERLTIREQADQQMNRTHGAGWKLCAVLVEKRNQLEDHLKRQQKKEND
ncbi:hypothetical protein [Vibrio phage CKB-S2]|nr:hypothetical protein [Vibrio phage CKB-S2]